MTLFTAGQKIVDCYGKEQIVLVDVYEYDCQVITVRGGKFHTSKVFAQN